MREPRGVAGLSRIRCGILSHRFFGRLEPQGDTRGADDALWCSCIKPTPYGPQLRCKVNTEGPHKIQLISGEALTVEDLQRRQVLPIFAIRGI